MPKLRQRCRICEPDDPLAGSLCESCEEDADSLLLVAAGRYVDVHDVILALAASYSRAVEVSR
jgi:hypothetical protein